MEKQLTKETTTTNESMLAALMEKLAALEAANKALEEQLAKKASRRAPAPPKDIWSNSALLIDGNDHARLLVTLAVMTRDGLAEQDITQSDWVRHTLALQMALGAYKANATMGIAEASTRTAAGQLRRAREVIDIPKLQERTKRVVLDGFERAMYDHYKDRDLFAGAKEDTEKRWSRQRCELQRADWRDHWTEENNWRPENDSTIAIAAEESDDNESGDN